MQSPPSGKASRQCPQCGVTLTRYEWSKLWWMSGVMSGRLVQPCGECGVKLKMSSMALVSSAAAIGLIATAVSYLFYPHRVLLLIALGLLLVILVAMLATRIEAVPSPIATLDPPPERISKKRL